MGTFLYPCRLPHGENGKNRCFSTAAKKVVREGFFTVMGKHLFFNSCENNVREGLGTRLPETNILIGTFPLIKSSQNIAVYQNRNSQLVKKIP